MWGNLKIMLCRIYGVDAEFDLTFFMKFISPHNPIKPFYPFPPHPLGTAEINFRVLKLFIKHEEEK
jgi:hypothetical protein